MNVGNKTLLIVLLMLVCVVSTTYFLAHRILLKGFQELENQSAKQNVQRVINNIKEDIATMKMTAADWAAWDDTYEFVVTSSTEYIHNNLQDDTCEELRLNLFMIVDTSGRIIFEKGFDLQNSKAIPVPQDIQEHLNPDDPLIRDLEKQKGMNGLLLLKSGPMFFSAHPILTSKDEGPSRGALVMGRWLNDTEIQRLGRLTNLTLNMRVADADELEPDFRRAQQELLISSAFYIHPLNENQVAGYATLPDIYGRPSFILRADIPRSIYKQGVKTMGYLIASLLAVGVVFAITFILLLEKQVLSRLASLSRGVISLGMKGDLSGRVDVSGHDELTILAGAINGMLESLERAQRDHRESEERYRTLVETSPDAILFMDLETRILIANQGAAHILGFSAASELIGRPAIDFVSDQDRARFYRESGGNRLLDAFQNLEIDLQKSDGTLFPAELSASIFVDSAGEPSAIVVVARDISERRSFESRLFQIRKMEAIGQLAGGVAHDFNNILTGILGNISRVLLDLDPDSEEHQMLIQAEKAGRRATELVKQLLAAGRQSPVVLQPVRLEEIMDEVAAIARNTFDRRIEIQVRHAEALSPIQGDPSQLHNVLLNLCLNARDALDQVERIDAPPTLRLSLEAENVIIPENDSRLTMEAAPGPYVRLTVGDTGIGMDEETMKRIFEPFFTTKSFGKGTGLGLATVYGIIKQHQGWMDVSSTPGQGSRFDIYLPMAESTSPKLVENKKTPELKGGQETLLVVDDEAVVRDLARTILERAGYTVLLAADGQEGLNLFQQEQDRIALVVLDISMPVLSGPEALAQMRAINPHTKVIISSGYGEESEMEEIRSLGVSAFVNKPYRLSDLLNTIDQILHQEREESITSVSAV